MNELLACGFFQRGLKLQNPDLLEPVLDERRPRRNRMLLAPQAEGVPALGEEMNLCRDARIIKSPRIDGAVTDFVDGVIPRLQQECRRRLLRDVYAGIESGAGATQMPRIKRNSKVRATA